MSGQPTESFSRIVENIQASNSILVATHIFPDGDALGSQLGLGAILESLGKKVFYYSEEPAADHYKFMPGCDKLDTVIPEPMVFDAALALDCGDQLRLGKEMNRLLEIRPFMVIDHHVGHKEFGDLRWVDPGLSSTGEMVYELAGALGAEINYDAAYCIYAAIVSDTGSFKYDSTTPDTFRIAGELIARGLKPFQVAGKLFENYTVSRLQLLKEVLATLMLLGQERIATITVTREMFDKTGACKEDTEDFINFPRSIHGVKVAVFFKEGVDNWISVSLRAKGECDVAKVARNFGGGGHRNAAGFRLQGSTISEVSEKLIAELVQILVRGE